jgi:hypothetical protein
LNTEDIALIDEADYIVLILAIIAGWLAFRHIILTAFRRITTLADCIFFAFFISNIDIATDTLLPLKAIIIDAEGHKAFFIDIDTLIHYDTILLI